MNMYGEGNQLCSIILISNNLFFCKVGSTREVLLPCDVSDVDESFLIGYHNITFVS